MGLNGVSPPFRKLGCFSPVLCQCKITCSNRTLSLVFGCKVGGRPGGRRWAEGRLRARRVPASSAEPAGAPSCAAPGPGCTPGRRGPDPARQQSPGTAAGGAGGREACLALPLGRAHAGGSPRSGGFKRARAAGWGGLF